MARPNFPDVTINKESNAEEIITYLCDTFAGGDGGLRALHFMSVMRGLQTQADEGVDAAATIIGKVRAVCLLIDKCESYVNAAAKPDPKRVSDPTKLGAT